MDKRLVIIGSGGHGKVIADIACNMGYTDIVFLDDDVHKTACGRYPVVGTSKDAPQYADCRFAVAIGACATRRRVQNALEAGGLEMATLVHPGAIVAADVRLGAGTVVMAGAVLNPDTTVGRGCIINTGATVDHDNVIEDFVHISVGSHLAGTVRVGECTMIGAGAVVSNNVSIGRDCMIGAGAVVVRDIETAGTYVGVPARKIR